MRYSIILLAGFLACSTPITQTETHVIPPVVLEEDRDGGTFSIVRNAECDTAAILAGFFPLQLQGQGYGLSYGVEVGVSIDTVFVDRVQVKWRVEVKRDSIVITDIDTVRITQVQEYSFWDKTELILSTIGIFVIILIIAAFLWKLKLI